MIPLNSTYFWYHLGQSKMILILFALLIILTSAAEDSSNELSSNVVDETTQNAVNIRENNIEKMMTNPKFNYSQKNRRSRYLRQTYRRRRRPTFDMQRNVRYPPPHPMYPSRNHFKPTRPYSVPKSKYRYHRDNWPPKWSNQNQAFGPYSAMNEDELESEPYDEYDDFDDFKNEDVWYSKKYRDGYDDVMPVSSKYSEKRTPTRFPANFHGTDYDRGRVRPVYDMYDGWPERNRFTRHYKDYLETMGPKKYVDNFEDALPASRIESHRFRITNGGRFRNDEDEYDFSGLHGMKTRRFKPDLTTLMQTMRPQLEENRYELEMPDISKYFSSRPAYTGKTETSQEVVYSAKYRGNNQEKENSKTSQEKKVDTSQSQHHSITDETNDWKRNQPVYQPYLADKTNYGGETNAARSQGFKSDQMLPSELIAYMSPDPSESVVGKEERFLESSFPYDILKTTYPRKISPAIDHDMEITFDERMSDWKH